MSQIIAKFFWSVGFLCLILALVLNLNSFMKKGDDTKGSIDPFPDSLIGIEIYDLKVAQITDKEEFRNFLEEGIRENKYSGIEIPIFVDDVIRKKYFHKISYIQDRTNWLLFLADKFFPKKEFFSNMKPKDLLKTNHGTCNQQAIVFQDLVKDFGYEFASVEFNIRTPKGYFGHFASAVKVDKEWFYFDPHREPDYNRRDSSILNALLEGDEVIFKDLYPSTKFENIDENMIILSKVNEFPARRGVIFQEFSHLISNYSWLIFFLLALIFGRFSKISNRKK